MSASKLVNYPKIHPDTLLRVWREKGGIKRLKARNLKEGDCLSCGMFFHPIMQTPQIQHEKIEAVELKWENKRLLVSADTLIPAMSLPEVVDMVWDEKKLKETPVLHISLCYWNVYFPGFIPFIQASTEGRVPSLICNVSWTGLELKRVQARKTVLRKWVAPQLVGWEEEGHLTSQAPPHFLVQDVPLAFPFKASNHPGVMVMEGKQTANKTIFPPRPARASSPGRWQWRIGDNGQSRSALSRRKERMQEAQ